MRTMPGNLTLSVAALATLTLLSSCREPAQVNDCDFALRPDKDLQAIVQTAIGLVNGAVEDPALRMEFVEESVSEQDFIPVYMVRPTESQGIVAHVREGCRAILIGGQEFAEAFAQFANASVLMQDREAEMLALLLLHELGHIDHGHYGAFLPSQRATTSNLDPTGAKAREGEADAFAAEVMREELAAMSTGQAYLPATFLVAFVSNLSFVISTQATLDCFGCRTLGSPDIFWDHSKSHENLEYRLLKMNYSIHPSDAARQLLADYERQREKSSKPRLRLFDPEQDF